MILAPSLFNSDLYLIKENLQRLDLLGITHLHIDVMDNHYVPSLGFNTNLVKDLKKHTNFILDCHLMLEKPELSINNFIEVKPDIITFHFEATVHHLFIINMIAKNNIKVGIAINPSTSVDSIKMLLPLVDLVLVMTVNPGQKGEVFLPMTLNKIEQLWNEKQKNNFHYDIQVDGNITDETILPCIKAGANNIVSGGFIFNNNEIENNITKLNIAMNKGY